MLVACGSSAQRITSVPVFTPVAGTTSACRAIMAQLPRTLVQQPRITSTGSPFGAIWGDPAIVLRCGVPEPAVFVHGIKDKLGPPCQTVNGIDWYLDDHVPDDASSSQRITVTTVFRSPAIEVSVPAHYGTQGPGTAMALLTGVIRAHTTVSNHCL